MIKKLIIASTFLLFSTFAFSQSFGGQTGAATYQSSKGGAITQPIQIWGEVARPGIYDVPIGSDFLAVISYAGGPTDLAKLHQVRLIRAKLQEGETETTIVVDVERYLLSGDKSELPEVRIGDTIIISPRFIKGVRTTMSNIQAIMSLVNAMVLIQYYSTR